MTRRWCAVAVALLLALSGCAGPINPNVLEHTDNWDGDPDNHWRSEVITVSYEPPAGNDRDYRRLVHRAAAYWTENSQRYAGYDVGLQLVDSAENADIHIRFVEDVSDCGAHRDEHTAGCAPVLTDARQVDRPVDVRVRTGLSDDSTVQVLKHELGHTLGLRHDDAPQAVMQAYSSLNTVPKPNATDRALPWRTNELLVYADYEALPETDREEARRQVRAALGYYADGAGGTVPENVTFYATDSRESADIVIEFGDTAACRTGSGSCGTLSGGDEDGDGALEYYDSLTIVLVDLDVDVIGWHVGQWLGTGFGHTDDSEYPEPLREGASYEERRSAWWE
ncbi:MAG: matrixin family metalloprotease [Natronomonas sp.]